MRPAWSPSKLLSAGLAAITVTAGLMTMSPEATASASQPATRAVLAPSADVATAPGLDGVSCAEPDYCMAIGQDHSELWDGHSWHVKPVPSPPSGTSQTNIAEMSGVSCPAKKFCVAVGTPEWETADGPTLMERWNGKKWSIMSGPDISGSRQLQSISCISSKNCTAVGTYDTVQCPNTTATGESYLIEHWNGQAWAIQTAPSPSACPSTADPSYTDELYGVSCASADLCMAVGYAMNQNSFLVPSAELWNGQAWSVLPDPTTGTLGLFSGVSCVHGGFCMAVGHSPANSPSTNLTFTYTHGTWFGLKQYRTPANASTAAAAVTCFSKTSCVEAGIVDQSGESTNLWVRRWSGGKRFATTTGPTDSFFASVGGIACTSPTSCYLAGGTSAFTTFIPQDELNRYNGASLRRHTLPPPTRLDNTADAVDCSAGPCVYAGSYTYEEQQQPAVGTLTKKHADAIPLNAMSGSYTANTQLNSVSCSAKGRCVAVGTDSDTGQTYSAIAELTDGRWIAGTGTTAGQVLNGVWCTKNNCIVVGSHVPTPGRPSRPLTESFDGVGFKTLPHSSPSGSSQLDGLTCLNSTSCIAVGSDMPTGGSERTFVESWNGHHWTIQKSANVHGTENDLSSVSCESAGRCFAVGTDGDGATQQPLIEVEHRGTWTILKRVAHVHYGSVNAVSCTPSTCVAAGSQRKSGAFHTLVMRLEQGRWSMVASADQGSGNEALNALSCTSNSCLAVGSRAVGAVEQTVSVRVPL